jgi:hypothetical protein
MVSVQQNIIDSIIYAMYTRENFEYCWGSWFGSHSEYSLYSIFTNALNKQGEFKEMIVMSDEVNDEDSCNDDDDSWAENCGFGMFYSRAAARRAERC